MSDIIPSAEALVEVLREIASGTSAVTEMNKAYKQAENELARAIRAGITNLSSQQAALRVASEEQKKLKRAVEEATQATDALSVMARDLKQAELELAEAMKISAAAVELAKTKIQQKKAALNDYQQALEEAKQKTDAFSVMNRKLAKTSSDLAEAYARNATNLQYYVDAHEDAKKTLEGFQALQRGGYTLEEKCSQAKAKLTKAIKEHSPALAAVTQEYKKAFEEQKKNEQQMAKIQKQVEKLTTSWKGHGIALATAFKEVRAGIGSCIDSVLGLATTLGLGSISFKEIVSNGMEYQKGLYDISRVQTVAGSSVKGFVEDLKQVSVQTGLSEFSFAKLVSTIMRLSIGIKPTSKEMSDFSNVLGRQVGKSLESQKVAAENLYAIQGKFPDLFNKITRAMSEAKAMGETGGGTATQKEKLSYMNSEIQALMRLRGMNEENINTIQTYTAVVTENDLKTRSSLDKQAVATEALLAAQKKLWETVQPYVTKAIEMFTGLFKFIADNKNVIAAIAGIGATVATVIGTVSTMFKIFTSAKAGIDAIRLLAGATGALGGVARTAGLALRFMTGPVGWIITAVGLIAGGLALWKARSKDIKVATEQQVKSEQELVAEKQAQVEKSKKVADEAKLLEVQSRYNLIALQATIPIVKGIQEGMKGAVEASTQFGLVNKEAFKNLQDITGFQLKLDTQNLKAEIENASNNLKGKGISVNIDFKKDVQSQVQDIQKQAVEAAKNAKSEQEGQDILAAISGIMEKNLALTLKQSEVSKLVADSHNQEIAQMEQVTSKYEARLNAERQLMESAQFGMGASVEMMQKQVDLAHENLAIIKKENEAYGESFVLSGKISRATLERLKNSKSGAETQRIIESSVKNEGGNYQQLNQFAAKHQENLTKEFQQQQKIYDITKDVREGYLDAIREMSTGAGEFDKIIGTQKEGASQLMGYVDRFAKGALNTSTMGGMQSQGLTASGVGTDITGAYTVGGFKTSLSAEQENARSGRLHMAKEYEEKYNKERNGQAERPTVGGALGITDKDSGALRTAEEDEKVTENGVYKGMKKLIREGGRDMMQGVNSAFKQDTRMYFSDAGRNNVDIGWGTNYLNNSGGARGGGRGSPPAIMSSSGQNLSANNAWGINVATGNAPATAGSNNASLNVAAQKKPVYLKSEEDLANEEKMLDVEKKALAEEREKVSKISISDPKTIKRSGWDSLSMFDDHFQKLEEDNARKGIKAEALPKTEDELKKDEQKKASKERKMASVLRREATLADKIERNKQDKLEYENPEMARQKITKKLIFERKQIQKRENDIAKQAKDMNLSPTGEMMVSSGETGKMEGTGVFIPSFQQEKVQLEAFKKRHEIAKTEYREKYPAHKKEDINASGYVKQKAATKESNVLGKLDQKEMENLSVNMRQSLGDIKAGRGEKDFEGRMEKTLIHKAMESGETPWLTMSPQAREQYMKAAKEASKKGYKKDQLGKGAREGMIMETMRGAETGSYTSEAQKKGMEASAAGQEYAGSLANQLQKNAAFGETEVGGAGGGVSGGRAVVLIQLDPGLMGTIQEAKGLQVEMHNAMSSTR